MGRPTLAVFAAGVWPKQVLCGVTAATALDLRSTGDMAVLSARVAPPTRNKIEHGRELIVFGLLGHRGVVKPVLSASRSRLTAVDRRK